jgi:hypothetical protein
LDAAVKTIHSSAQAGAKHQFRAGELSGGPNPVPGSGAPPLASAFLTTGESPLQEIALSAQLRILAPLSFIRSYMLVKTHLR